MFVPFLISRILVRSIIPTSPAEGPFSTLVLAGIIAMFATFVWTMYKTEKQLNWDGESLVYPWKVRNPRTAARRLDRTLNAATRALARGRDEEDVLCMLRQVEGMVPVRARPHYNLAVARLEDAAYRDWVFDAERRRRDLGEDCRFQ